ncbi:MAG: PD-(D/E)XK nuclease family protein [Oscillospiraceae bacterium]|nr:PD-(D/E)XK nuclease family protein [Oscillospiraceae bacterium]
MLKLLLGRAGSGKTGALLREISALTEKKIGKTIYIVPEQYSHDAERELVTVCPDDVSLYAEVLSFSRLAGRVFQEVGGLAEKTLDKGGRVLTMSLAVAEAAPKLKVYSFGQNKTDFLLSLISAYDELRASCVDNLRLADAADGLDESFRDKISDIALIFECYDRIREKSGLDPRDKLDKLIEGIEGCTLFDGANVFIDGFSDFTMQEMRVIDEILRKECDITVALTTPSIDNSDSCFSLPSKTARSLMALASTRRVRCAVETLKKDDNGGSLCYLEKSLFDHRFSSFDGNADNISVVTAASPSEELSFAAAEAHRLARSGARWREIAIVSPDWGKYAPLASGILHKYHVPFNSSEKSDVLSKPILSFVTSALELIGSSWNHEAMFRYVKTGFAGANPEDIDLIENYVIRWGIKGETFWLRDADWKMHPQGYSETMTEGDKLTLRRVNEIRRSITDPLGVLSRGLKNAETAIEKAQALYEFFERSALYDKLVLKTEELYERGENRMADEYSQLWELLLNALRQFADIMGEAPLGTDEFVRLFRLMLSQYEIGAIPSSVDAVGVGDMRRMRGRGIKHLFILGASDSAMPSLQTGGDIFSEEERDALRDAGIDLTNSADECMERELGLINSSFTMPSDSLTITCPAYSRRSFIATRIMKVFSLPERTVDDSINLESESAVFELAASPIIGGRSADLAKAYFAAIPEKRSALEMLVAAAKMPRGRLSHITAENLYSRNISLSASKLDKFYSCRFSYFLKYGLKLRRREEASLDAPESGTFVHFILENVTREVMKSGGYHTCTDEEIIALSKRYSVEYAEKKLGGLEEKSGRFRYLFNRLCDDAERIALNMARELRKSDFEPLAFELSFAKDGDLPAISVEGREGSVSVNGVVDRIDGYIHDGKLYIRVVDYKTGRKVFKLGDILNGMSMQMLIYLFALQNEGSELFKKEIVPAGVLYAPARDPITSVQGNVSDEELMKEKLKNTKRTGLILNDPAIVAAMESGDKKEYIPVSVNKDGAISGESLVSLEELGEISRHIDSLIAAMGDEVRRGSITADPYFKGVQDNACLYCDYFGACHFRVASADDRFRFTPSLKAPEAMKRIRGEKNGRN